MKPEHAEVVCQSEGMRATVEALTKLASNNQPVLLLGEEGTGKSRLARLLVSRGAHAEADLVEVSYDPRPSETVREELFGAEAEHPGALVAAHGSTMLIDELRSLTLAAQDELLQFFETGQARGRACEVRVVLLSHVANLDELRALVGEGSVRPQFIDSSRVLVVTVPPLRARREELPQLCQDILREEAETWGLSVPSITAEALAVLAGYHWPKNTSELKRVLKKALRACEGQVIHTQHLPEELRA